MDFAQAGWKRRPGTWSPPRQTTPTVTAKQIAMPKPREGKANTTANRPRADARWLYALPLVSLAIQLKTTYAGQEREPGVRLTNRDGSGVRYGITSAFSNEYVCPSGLLREIGADPDPSVGTVQDRVCASTKLHFVLRPLIVTVVPVTKPLPLT